MRSFAPQRLGFSGSLLAELMGIELSGRGSIVDIRNGGEALKLQGNDSIQIPKPAMIGLIFARRASKRRTPQA
jgi:hypothetical protein